MAHIVDSSDYVWLERTCFDNSEANYQKHILQLKTGNHSTQPTTIQQSSPIKKSIASEIAKARQHISETLNCKHITENVPDSDKEHSQLHTKIQNLESSVSKLTERLVVLENICKQYMVQNDSQKTLAPAVVNEKNEEEDDFELFGSDEEVENEEANRVKQERLKAYEDKKSKKPVLIAKSNIILDVKPWDDETDMAILEQSVRSIEMDGLLWGASKLVPLAYGIKKLQISCVVEDDKVSVDDLEEKIVGFEDYIQSMDIAAFNKI